MSAGFFVLHRQLFDKPIWLNSTPEQKVILITLIKMANFTSKSWEWMGKPFVCERGQFITSAASIEKNCGSGITRQNIRTALKRFEKLEFLTIESTKTGMLITICNYSKYQDINSGPNQAPNQDLTKTQPTANQDLTTSNKVNNTNKETNKASMSKLESFDEQQEAEDSKVTPIDRVPYEKIVELFHETLSDLPRVAKVTATRKSHIRARWKNDLPSLDEWKKYFLIIKQSDFLMGRVQPMPGKKIFQANIDFVITESNVVKICEGRYHG